MSAIAVTSCTSCVTITDVSPKASLRRRISRTMTPMEIGSRPTKGSSYSTTMGSSTIARASATRLAMPPESSSGISRQAPRSPTSSSFIKTTSRTSASGRSVCSRSGKATFSKTDRSVSKAPLWNSMPMRRRKAYSALRPRSGTETPSTRTLPAAGRNCPPISRSRVVLPVPLGPITAVILPRGMARSMSSKITRRPRLNVRSRISTS